MRDEIYSLCITLHYFKKEVSEKEFDFSMLISIKVSARWFEKFAIPLWYLKKEVGDEVDFSRASKHQVFIIFDLCGKVYI